MIRELDCVALTEDLPGYRLKRGDIGAVVDAIRIGGPFLVEFVAPNGETIALITLEPSQVRSVRADPDEREQWRTILDIASAKFGPRLRMTDLTDVARDAAVPLNPARSVTSLRKLNLVNPKTKKKRPRVLVFQDPVHGQVVVDTKAVPRERRRAVQGAWYAYRKAFRSLDSNIPAYQQKLRDLLEVE